MALYAQERRFISSAKSRCSRKETFRAFITSGVQSRHRSMNTSVICFHAASSPASIEFCAQSEKTPICTCSRPSQVSSCNSATKWGSLAPTYLIDVVLSYTVVGWLPAYLRLPAAYFFGVHSCFSFQAATSAASACLIIQSNRAGSRRKRLFHGQLRIGRLPLKGAAMKEGRNDSGTAFRVHWYCGGVVSGGYRFAQPPANIRHPVGMFWDMGCGAMVRHIGDKRIAPSSAMASRILQDLKSNTGSKGIPREVVLRGAVRAKCGQENWERNLPVHPPLRALRQVVRSSTLSGESTFDLFKGPHPGSKAQNGPTAVPDLFKYFVAFTDKAWLRLCSLFFVNGDVISIGFYRRSKCGLVFEIVGKKNTQGPITI